MTIPPHADKELNYAEQVEGKGVHHAWSREEDQA
jgi:hypothetical protein